MVYYGLKYQGTNQAVPLEDIRGKYIGLNGNFYEIKRYEAFADPRLKRSGESAPLNQLVIYSGPFGIEHTLNLSDVEGRVIIWEAKEGVKPFLKLALYRLTGIAIRNKYK